MSVPNKEFDHRIIKGEYYNNFLNHIETKTDNLINKLKCSRHYLNFYIAWTQRYGKDYDNHNDWFFLNDILNKAKIKRDNINKFLKYLIDDDIIHTNKKIINKKQELTRFTLFDYMTIEEADKRLIEVINHFEKPKIKKIKKQKKGGESNPNSS